MEGGLRDAPAAIATRESRTAKSASIGRNAQLEVAPLRETVRVLPFIDHGRGVQVAEGEGLLIVEYDAPQSSSTILRVGSRDLGKAPAAVALPEGRHELRIQGAAGPPRVRMVEIRAGETRILALSD
jgi:hypothetical protein